MCSIWKQTGGPPRSRASSAVAAASPPPALVPTQGHPRRVDARARRPRRGGTTARRSSRAGRPGYGCSGARRYSTETTTAPVSMAIEGRAGVLAPRRCRSRSRHRGSSRCRAPVLRARPPRAGRPAPARRGRPPSPGTARSSMSSVSTPGIVGPDGDEHLLEGPARRDRVREVDLRQQVDQGRQLRVDHRVSLPPRSSWPTSAACGCRRRCGSTRRSCTSWTAAPRASVANSVGVARAGAGRARPGPACP